MDKTIEKLLKDYPPKKTGLVLRLLGRYSLCFSIARTRI